MPVLTNIGLLATCRAGKTQADLHAISDAALAWEGERLAWVGAEAELPERYRDDETHDAGGRLVVPGLVDCHTHLAFGGWRADEFAQRLEGATYLDIARAGGGIASTVRQTRAASEDDLFEIALHRLREMARLGVTTVEAKSGYGLTVEDEVKLLRVYRRLNAAQPVRVVPTFLGAHTVPPEYRDRRAEYVRLVVDAMLPAVEGLADFCDVFVEDTAFSVDEARTILARAQAFGMRPKLHVDQLSDGGGARLAAVVGAVSADHLEYAAPDGIRAMAEAGVVAVSLPLASLYLRQSPMPARAFLDAGVSVAVATDFNPGSAPSYHLPLAMSLACITQRMTPAEVLVGATRVAAQAVGLEAEVGSLEQGKRADFAVVDAPDVNHWLYHFRANAVVRTCAGGRFLAEDARG